MTDTEERPAGVSAGEENTSLPEAKGSDPAPSPEEELPKEQAVVSESSGEDKNAPVNGAEGDQAPFSGTGEEDAAEKEAEQEPSEEPAEDTDGGETGEPEEDPDNEEDIPYVRPKRLGGFFRGELPKLDRKSVAVMLVITLLYSLLAFFRLGTDRIPQTSIYLAQKGQSVTVELKEPSEVSKFCLYKWRGRKKDITIETRLDLDDEWHVAYGPEELSSHMRWKTLDLDVEGEVKYIRITFEGKEITLAELCVLDKNNERLDITVPKELNAKLLDADHLDNLTDEQELLDADSSSLTFAYFDEYLYALTANAYIHGGPGLENTHPVLGKVVESLGIRLFGMNSIGWRIMGTLSGILMLPVFFFLARRVLRSNKWALAATFLMAVEAMHYTQTRLATIDSFPLLFILLAYLFMIRYYQHPRVEGEKVNLFLSGLAFGLACSFKWIGAYAGVGLAIVFFAFFISKIRAYRREDPDFYTGRYVASTIASCVLFFVLIPAVVYIGSYLPVAFGPFPEIEGWAGIWENQKYMWNFHSTLEQTFDFSSKWWGWPLLLGGFSSYFGTSLEGLKARIIVTGNPVIWWASVPAVLYAAYGFFFGRRVRTPLLRRSPAEGELLPAEIGMPGWKPAKHWARIERFDAGIFLAVIAYLCQYVPWMLVTRELFIYHYFASAEISILLITWVLKRWSANSRTGRIATGIYLGLAALLFAAMFPILNGFFVQNWYMEILRVFL